MAFDKDAFLTALDSMSVMELNDLVKAIEEKFGVSAAAMAAPAAGGGAAAECHQPYFGVFADSAGRAGGRDRPDHGAGDEHADDGRRGGAGDDSVYG